jgi:hypothetical protein
VPSASATATCLWLDETAIAVIWLRFWELLKPLPPPPTGQQESQEFRQSSRASRGSPAPLPRWPCVGADGTWDTDLELGVVVVDDDVVAARHQHAVVVDVDYIVLHIGLYAEGMPARSRPDVKKYTTQLLYGCSAADARCSQKGRSVSLSHGSQNDIIMPYLKVRAAAAISEAHTQRSPHCCLESAP